jgi:hypothetical protein
MHPCVDLPYDSYMLVPEGGDEGAGGELQYVDVDQDLDQSPEGPKANLADEGKPWIINPSFFRIYATTFAMFMHIHFRS